MLTFEILIMISFYLLNLNHFYNLNSKIKFEAKNNLIFYLIFDTMLKKKFANLSPFYLHKHML